MGIRLGSTTRRWIRFATSLILVAAASVFLWVPAASADNCSTFGDCFGQSGAASEAAFGLMLLAALSLLTSFLPNTVDGSGQEFGSWERSVGILRQPPAREQVGPFTAGVAAPSASARAGQIGPVGAVVDQVRDAIGQTGDLTDQVHERFPDPVEAQAVLDLMGKGATIDIAAAAVSGDWSEVPGGDPSLYTDDQRRSIVGLLDLDAGSELAVMGVSQLFEAMHPWAVAQVFNKGMTLDLAVDVPGMGSSGQLLSAGTQLRASTELSNARIGPGFSQTHETKVTGELVRRVGGPLTGRDLGYLKDAFEHVEDLPPELRKWLENSPTASRITGLPVGFSAEAFVGEQLQYSAIIGPEQATHLADGDKTMLPDIYNPDSFEPGNSAVIRGGDIEGSNFEFRYKKLVIGGSTGSFDGLGFGVTRINDTTIAVFSGPIEAVESQTRVGVPGLALSGTRVAERTVFAYAEIDISTPQGMQVYADFVAGNGVPTRDAPGVVAAAKDTVALEADLGIKVGPVELQWSDTEASRTTTTYADGREVMSGEARGDNSYFSYTFDPVTYEVESATVVVTDIGEDTAQSLRVYGLNEPPLDAHAQDIQMVFTNADLEALQAMAKVAQGASSPAPYGPTVSLQDQIVAAESPAEVAEILQQRSFADPHNTLFELEQIARDVSTSSSLPPTLPGQFEFRPTD